MAKKRKIPTSLNSMHVVHSKKRKPQKRKPYLWTAVSLILLVLIGLLIYCTDHEAYTDSVYQSVGVCGCVKNQGVYRISQGADLGTLVMAANGLSYNADIHNMDLSTIVKKDSIYHIPCGQKKTFAPKPLPKLGPLPALRNKQLINILYIGFPSVFLLIQFHEDGKKINVINIPHNSLVLNGEIRVMDLYFTMGIEYLKAILEIELEQKIDFHYVQHKTSFIKMIDQLGGLNLNLDEQFEQAYQLKTGEQKIDGKLAFEYIRYIDKSNHRTIHQSTSKATISPQKLNNLQLAFVLREHRQRLALQSIRNRINEIKQHPFKVHKLGAVYLANTESSLNIKEAFSLLKLYNRNTQISYSTLPGSYKQNNHQVLYTIDHNALDMMFNRNNVNSYSEDYIESDE